MKKCCTCKQKLPQEKFWKNQGKCKSCCKKYQQAYYLQNQDREQERGRLHYYNNKKRRSNQMKAWKKENKEYWANYQHAYWLNNKQKLLENKYERHHKKMKSDECYALTHKLRTRFSIAIRNNQKSGSAIKDLGCSIPKLKQWLEQQFQPDMTWDNYGKWHIDHIIPLSAFNLSDSKQVKKACHWFNLQPLWAKDNLSKGGRI